MTEPVEPEGLTPEQQNEDAELVRIATYWACMPEGLRSVRTAQDAIAAERARLRAARLSGTSEDS